MLYHNQNPEIILTIKKRHRTQAPHSTNQHAVLDPMLFGCERWFVSSGDFPPNKMDPDQARQRDFYWIQTDGISYILNLFLKRVKFKKKDWKKKDAYKIMSMLRVHAYAC